MEFGRREFLQFAGGAAALFAVSRVAQAQTYPTRPVHLIVGLAPAGAQDISARLMGQWLSEQFKQPFIIENRTGAGGNIGTEFVVRSPADGYTLLLAATPNAINATLYEHLDFDFIRDIEPIAGIMRVPDVMLVNPSLPTQTVPEFIAYAKANPGKLNMATAGNGSTPHIFGELFKMMAGVNLTPVPYRGGGPALVDLIDGQVQVMFEPILSSIAYVRAGKLRALAVTSATRAAALPDVPTVGEFVPGYEATAWFGLGAPRNTPTEIIDQLNRETNAGFTDPATKERIAKLGGTPMPMTPGEFHKLIADEIEKWGKVIRAAGIKLS